MILKYVLVAVVGLSIVAGASGLGYLKGHEIGYRKGVDEYVGHLTRLKRAQDNLRQKQVDAMNQGLVWQDKKYKELEKEYNVTLEKYREGQTDEIEKWNNTPVPELYRN